MEKFQTLQDSLNSQWPDEWPADVKQAFDDFASELIDIGVPLPHEPQSL